MTETTETLQETLQDAIIKTLSQPKKIQSEAGSVEQHSIAELIAADKYLTQKKAANAGMQFIKVNNN
ncbi:MAG: hypothetical protein LBC02_00885 [Planctomycetaceae bacterium]|jgi:hypothetical protein|nr:hypothetical protein [Planctomycetaceae bacterium]